jgi:hypothetical protein
LSNRDTTCSSLESARESIHQDTPGSWMPTKFVAGQLGIGTISQRWWNHNLKEIWQWIWYLATLWGTPCILFSYFLQLHVSLFLSWFCSFVILVTRV